MNFRFEETDPYSNACKDKTNHTCVGGYARIVAAVKQLKAERINPLYINVGDNFSGTLWYSIDKWNVTSYFLNLLPADVMVSDFVFNIESFNRFCLYCLII